MKNTLKVRKHNNKSNYFNMLLYSIPESHTILLAKIVTPP